MIESTSLLFQKPLSRSIPHDTGYYRLVRGIRSGTERSQSVFGTTFRRMNRNRMRCGNVFRFLRHDAVPLHREISERQRSDSCDTSCRITFPAEIPVHRCRKRTVPLCRISASGRSGKRSSRHHDSPGIEIVRILLQSLCRFQDISGAGNSRIVRRLVSVAGNIRRHLTGRMGRQAVVFRSGAANIWSGTA